MLDPSYPVIKMSQSPKHDWRNFFNIEGELKSPNMPKPLGMEFVIRGYVDADHAGDKVTRQSKTGFIIFVNSAPIYWLLKKQAGV